MPADSQREFVFGIFLASVLQYHDIRDAELTTRMHWRTFLVQLYKLFGLSVFDRCAKILSDLSSEIFSDFLLQFSSTIQYELELPWVSGILYEQFLLTQNLNQDGIFYTPRPLVNEMLKKCTLVSNEKSKISTILDPACGAGAFLVEAYESLLGNQCNIRLDLHFFEDCLFGVDQDSSACEVARFALLIKFWVRNHNIEGLRQARQFLEKNIRAGNSLLGPQNLPPPSAHELSTIKPFDWAVEFDAPLKAGGFDLIIGNPPYGLSRDEQLTELENELIKRRYERYRAGKFNKYLAFMARGYELLKDGGILSFIVPNSWLGIRSGKPLRELFLKSQSLKSITSYGTSAFPHLGLETVSFLVQKNGSHPCFEVMHVTCGLGATSNAQVLSTSDCLSNPDALIPLHWGNTTAALSKKIQAKSFALGGDNSPFEPLIALQAYSKGRGTPPQTAQDVEQHVFDCDTKIDKSCVPYLDGRDVRRYEYQWKGRYLRYGPWLSEYQPLSRYKGPRILLREIIGPSPYVLSGSVAEELLVYNRSILHILLKPQHSSDLVWALLAILNSSTGSFIIRNFGRKSQRKLFPKIVNDDLKGFPVAQSLLNEYQSLAEKVRLISELVKERVNSARSEIDSLQLQLNSIVAEMYELSEKDLS